MVIPMAVNSGVKIEINGVISEIPRSAAKRIKYIRNLFGATKDDEAIPLPDISNDIIGKLIIWCGGENYNLTESQRVEFINNCEKLKDVLNAADFLDVEGLVEFWCKCLLRSIRHKATNSRMLAAEFAKMEIDTLNLPILLELLDHADVVSFEILCKLIRPTCRQYQRQLTTIFHDSYFARSCQPDDACEKYTNLIQAQRCLSRGAQRPVTKVTHKRRAARQSTYIPKGSCRRLLHASTGGYPVGDGEFLRTSTVDKLEFSHDMSFMYTLHRRKCVLYIWDLRERTPMLLSTMKSVIDATFGTKYLFTSYLSGTITAWMVDNPIVFATKWCTERPHAVYPRGKGFVAVEVDYTRRGELSTHEQCKGITWNGDLGDELMSHEMFDGVSSAAFPGDGCYGAFTLGSKIYAWGYSTEPINTENEEMNIVLHSPNEKIIFGVVPSSVTIWCPVEWNPTERGWYRDSTRKLRPDDISLQAFTYATFSPNGQYIAISGHQVIVILTSGSFGWLNYKTVTWIRLVDLGMKRDFKLKSIAWSPDGRFLAAGHSTGVSVVDVDVFLQLSQER